MFPRMRRKSRKQQLLAVSKELRLPKRCRCLSRILKRIGIAAIILSLRGLGLGSSTGGETPEQLIRKTIANELRAESAHYMYRARTRTKDGLETRVFVRTTQGTADLLISINDQPSDQARQQAELGRLNYLISHPAEARRMLKEQQEEASRITRILQAMPDAFIYEFDPVDQPSSRTCTLRDSFVRLKMRPNPSYSPPTRIEQLLTGMQGFVVIDCIEYRVRRIDGILFKDVNFGWGVLGHLDKGGGFMVEQAQIGDGHWEIIRMDLNFTGRILLLKRLVIKSSEEFTSFQRLPENLTLDEGVALLKKQLTNPFSSTVTQFLPVARLYMNGEDLLVWGPQLPLFLMALCFSSRRSRNTGKE